MMSERPYLSQAKDGVLLTVYVQPRSSRTRLSGVHGQALKLCITAPPVDNKANTMVVAFLASLFKLPKSAFSICSGQQSRTKQVRLSSLSLTEAGAIIDQALSS